MLGSDDGADMLLAYETIIVEGSVVLVPVDSSGDPFGSLRTAFNSQCCSLSFDHISQLGCSLQLASKERDARRSYRYDLNE